MRRRKLTEAVRSIDSRLTLSFNCLSCAREGPPAFSCLTFYSPLHGTFRSSIQPARPDAAFSLSSTALSFLPSRMKIVICRFDFGCRCNRIGRSTLWQDQSPGQTNPKTRRIVLCPPDIPIERKSCCLVIPRLQHGGKVNSSRRCRRF